MTFLVWSGKKIFIFPENMVLFFRRKIHGNMIFSLYSAKMVFLFPTNMILTFCQKIFSQKMHLKMTFLVSLERMILILEKLKIMKKTSVINKNNTSNRFVIINLPSLICKNLRSTFPIFTPFFQSDAYSL